jgi:hypothetical protein
MPGTCSYWGETRPCFEDHAIIPAASRDREHVGFREVNERKAHPNKEPPQPFAAAFDRLAQAVRAPIDEIAQHKPRLKVTAIARTVRLFNTDFDVAGHQLATSR